MTTETSASAEIVDVAPDPHPHPDPDPDRDLDGVRPPRAAADLIGPVDRERGVERRRRRTLAWLSLAAVGAGLSAAWIGMLFLIRAQGVGITGDEPHYLVEAISIGQFHTLNMNPGYVYAVRHHAVYPWTATPGPHLAAVIGQALWHHGLYLPFHAIGLSVFLAVPMLFGTSTAVITLVVALALLTTVVLYLTGEASQVTSPARNLVGLLYLAPPFMLAAVQVFPDLVSGLLIAIVVMVIATMEARGRPSRPQLIGLAACLVVLPWLDQKNIFFPFPLLVAVAVAFVRVRVPRRVLSLVALPSLISLASLLALNLYAFGDALGGPQRIQLTGLETLTRALALLVDRRQGLLVQAPVVLLGFAGLWIMRKRLPVATVTATFVVVATVYGNATQTDSFGGYSFVGRFQWPTLPVLFAFAGLTLLHLWRVRRPVAVVAAVLSLATFVSPFLLVVRREHAYYNLSQWDPQTYAGWFGGLDPSPILGYIGRDDFLNARVDWGLLCVLAFCGLVIYAVVVAAKGAARWWPWVLSLLAVGVAVSYPATLSATPLQPTFPSAASLVPLQRPVVVCDTRPGNPSHLTGESAQCSDGLRGSTLRPGTPLTFAVGGAFGVPAHHVTAVVLGITTVNSASSGAVTVFPGDQSPPAVPTFQSSGTEPLSTFATVGVGGDGTVSVVSTVNTDVVVALEGYTTSSPGRPGLLYRPLARPVRLCAATVGSEEVPGGCPAPTSTSPRSVASPTAPISLTSTDEARPASSLVPLLPLRPVTIGVPGPAVGAVELQVTAVRAGGTGSLAVSSSSSGLPSTTILHFVTGQSVSNSAILRPGPFGTVTLVSSAPTDVAVDIVGSFVGGPRTTGSRFMPELGPVRICDTRGSNPSALSGLDAQCDPGSASDPKGRPLAPGESRTIQVVGLSYVPPGATAAELVVTPVPDYTDVLALGGATKTVDPASSSAAPPPGGYANGAVLAPLTRRGTVVVTNVSDAPVNMTVDLMGWYEPRH